MRAAHVVRMVIQIEEEEEENKLWREWKSHTSLFALQQILCPHAFFSIKFYLYIITFYDQQKKKKKKIIARLSFWEGRTIRYKILFSSANAYRWLWIERKAVYKSLKKTTGCKWMVTTAHFTKKFWQNFAKSWANECIILLVFVYQQSLTIIFLHKQMYLATRRIWKNL